MTQQRPFLPAGKVHDEFTSWAEHHGIVINKVRVAAFPGAGIGIVATNDIKAGDTLVFTPSAVLLTREVILESLHAVPQVPAKIGATRGVHELRTHALIAAALAVNAYKAQQPWQNVWPDYESFKACMPLLWPEQRQSSLPPSTLDHLINQRQTLKEDFKKVRNLGFQVTKSEYSYAWVLVNTRTLFYKPPSYHDVLRQDCMCLCPFIDYFNHSGEGGCKVELSVRGFVVTSDRDYKSGEQVFVSYGPHNNDFLLCEYGFILQSNRWQHVKIDGYILPRLTHQQKEHLSSAGFLGDYHIDPNGFCFRTQVALRMSFINFRSGDTTEKLLRWHRFIAGEDDGLREEYLLQDVQEFILSDLKGSALEILGKLERLGDTEGELAMGEIIRRRWDQILEVIIELREKTQGSLEA